MKIKPLGRTSHERIFQNMTIFYSYSTPICIKFYGQTLVTSQYYSRTTTRHIRKYIQHEPNVEYVDQEIIDNLIQTHTPY